MNIGSRHYSLFHDNSVLLKGPVENTQEEKLRLKVLFLIYIFIAYARKTDPSDRSVGVEYFSIFHHNIPSLVLGILSMCLLMCKLSKQDTNQSEMMLLASTTRHNSLTNQQSKACEALLGLNGSR